MRIMRLLALVAILALLPGLTACGTAVTTSLEPISVPTLPEKIPGYLELDPATGLHMTGKPTVVDFSTYRLKVSGLVKQELSLAYDDLRRLPKMTATPKLECPGYFLDAATWSGVSLQSVLELAGVQAEATRVVMKGADGYSFTLQLEEALNPDNFLAYELSGQPVPVLHGFPLRAVIPGAYGSAWVKWLLELKVE
jgi:DMSO/TMAO reductase YedYZ molybdopterin-dependent catalytic subunit